MTALALPDDDRRRLVGILDRLGSEHDGERAAAGLLATRLLRKHRVGWADLIGATEPPTPPRAPLTWRATVAACRRRAADLTQWESAFLVGLERWSKSTLTSRQAASLAEIVERLEREAAGG